eukprot:5194607-Pyramimonas_sp.AAC.1
MHARLDVDNNNIKQAGMHMLIHTDCSTLDSARTLRTSATDWHQCPVCKESLRMPIYCYIHALTSNCVSTAYHNGGARIAPKKASAFRQGHLCKNEERQLQGGRGGSSIILEVLKDSRGLIPDQWEAPQPVDQIYRNW